VIPAILTAELVCSPSIEPKIWEPTDEGFWNHERKIGGWREMGWGWVEVLSMCFV
jgi:hypothetical protein